MYLCLLDFLCCGCNTLQHHFDWLSQKLSFYWLADKWERCIPVVTNSCHHQIVIFCISCKSAKQKEWKQNKNRKYTTLCNQKVKLFKTRWSNKGRCYLALLRKASRASRLMAFLPDMLSMRLCPRTPLAQDSISCSTAQRWLKCIP